MASMYDEIMRAKEALGDAEDVRRPSAWVGTKVAIWDMLIDSGARIEPDGTPSPVLYAGVDVRYNEEYPPGMVVVLDQYGDVIVRMMQDRSRAQWYAMHRRSLMNSNLPVNVEGVEQNE